MERHRGFFHKYLYTSHTSKICYSFCREIMSTDYLWLVLNHSNLIQNRYVEVKTKVYVLHLHAYFYLRKCSHSLIKLPVPSFTVKLHLSTYTACINIKRR